MIVYCIFSQLSSKFRRVCVVCVSFIIKKILYRESVYVVVKLILLKNLIEINTHNFFCFFVKIII